METRELIWLELMKFHGLKEIPGEVDNPIIVAWFKELGFPEIQNDETAWCSLAVNIAAKHAGLPFTGRLDARSWMRVGKPVTEPKLGHITVFWRGEKTGWQGHVGLFAGLSLSKNEIYTLGGNQGNMLGIRAYPIDSPSFGLLGYREL